MSGTRQSLFSTIPVLGLVTPLGWTLVLTCIVTWVLGWQLGWAELFLMSAACLLTLVISGLFLLGSAILDLKLEAHPQRVFVGNPSAGRLVVTSRSRRRLLPLQVDLPIGAGLARFDIPSLGFEQEHEDLFVVPTNRRAVIVVGPASSVRGDPLGVLRRQAIDPQQLELFVHPNIVPLRSLQSGLLRDLEGQTTRDLSTSDLAFHTLRDYVPGDDRRYIHWRSSAKANKLLIRQFLDTRRSKIAVILDGNSASYPHEDDFETAVSVAGSLGVRVIRDELDFTFVGGGSAVTPSSTQQLLDGLCRVSLAEVGHDLGAAATHVARLGSDTSMAILLTGSEIPFTDVLAAASRFGHNVTTLAIRIEPGQPTGINVSGDLTVLSLSELRDLPILLAKGGDQ